MEYPKYKIPEYDIPYYEDNTRISNSAIGWFLNKGPAYFRRMLDGKEKGLDLPQLRKGTMIHEWLLQPEKFWDDYVLFDGEKPKSAQAQKFCENLINSVEIEPDERLVKAYSDAYSTVGKSYSKMLSEAVKLGDMYEAYIKATMSRKILISTHDLDQLKAIREKAYTHKLAGKLLRRAGDHGSIHVYHEFQINWENSGVSCKSLLDSCTFDWDNKVCTIMDIKTTGKLWHFEDSMKEFDYLRQLHFYQAAVCEYLKNLLGLQDDDFYTWKFNLYIIAIDTTGSNEIRVFDLSSNPYDYMKIYNAICDIRWHIEHCKWEHSRAYYEGDGSENLNL